MDEFLEKILKITSIGESVQVVALHGMGKSRFARQLVASSNDSHIFYHIDTNQMPDFSFKSFLNYIRLLVGRKVQDTKDLTALSLETSQIVSDLAKEKSITFVLDYVDDLLIPNNKNVFRFLKVLRDAAKYKISYLFMIKRPIKPHLREILNDLYELVSEHVLYLPLMSNEEFEKQVVASYGPNVSFIPGKYEIEEIKRLSGKIPALIKISMQAMRDDTTLNFSENHRLRGQLEEMVASLSQEELMRLSDIASGKIVKDNHASYLKNLGLINEVGKVTSTLLRDFLLETSERKLTKSEALLLELLKENKGNTVGKDKICERVYPGVKNINGISDHAIDQIIHRLRYKVSSEFKIDTLRGRGYILY